MFDLIMDWILTPLLDMLSRRHLSGKWHMSYLFPISTAVGGIMWWLGGHYGITLLLIFGVLITVFCGLFSIITYIHREAGFWQDMKSYHSMKKKEAVEQDADSGNEP